MLGDTNAHVKPVGDGPRPLRGYSALFLFGCPRADEKFWSALTCQRFAVESKSGDNSPHSKRALRGLNYFLGFLNPLAPWTTNMAPASRA